MLNRRTFVGCLLGTICAGLSTPSEAILHRAAVAAPFVFQGNPNVTTSAVDVATNGIQSSRTITTQTVTGGIPFIVQVSASGVLCTGTNTNGNPVLPYEDLMYVFTDGQGSSSDTVVNPTNNLGTVVSTGTQTGPEALFCYRTAGTFTITMTVYYQTAPGVYANVTQTLTVVAQNNIASTFYVDSVNGNTLWDGTAPTFVSGTTGPKATTADIQTLLNGSINNRQILLCEGSTFTIASGGSRLSPQNGQAHNGLRLNSYTYSGNPGAGNKPIINSIAGGVAGGSFSLFDFGFGSVNCSGDMVVSNVHFQVTGSSTVASCIGASGGTTNPFQNLYVDNCFLECTLNISHSNSLFSMSVKPNPWSGVGFWKCVMQSPIVVSSSLGHAVFCDCKQWFSMLGCTMSGSGASPTFDHHVYPDCYQHSCYRWNAFGETGLSGTNDQRNCCINMTTVDGNASWHYMGDNCFGTFSPTTGSSPIVAHDGADVNNDPLGGGTFANMVCERNFMVGLGFGTFLNSSCQLSETVRFNNWYGAPTLLGGGAFCKPNPSLGGSGKFQIYNNNIDLLSTSSGSSGIDFDKQDTAYTASATSPATFTCNNTSNAAGSIAVGTILTLLSTVGSISAGDYFVVSAVRTTAWVLQLSLTKGGSPINNTGSAGTANLRVTWKGNPQSVFNNSIMDNRATPAIWLVDAIANFGGNGSIIDNNNYWWGTLPGTKNTQTVFFDSDASTAANYPTWSGAGLDVHSTFNQPTWSDPAHGIFS